MKDKVTFETGKTYNVMININRGASEKAYVYEPTDEELKSLSYEQLDDSQVWLYDEYVGEKILRTIWKTERQRDELKQRWRDLRSSQNAKKAERQAELRKQGGVTVVRL